jgi:hypothetical protein
LDIHQHEFSEYEQATLDGYHNLNTVFQYCSLCTYSGYDKFYISRNPFGRIVSAFWDQYAYVKNEGVLEMLKNTPPTTTPGNRRPDNFIEFLEYLKSVPDAKRDIHFRTQAYFEFADKVVVKRGWLKRNRPEDIRLNSFADISQFNNYLTKTYRKLFKSNPAMRDRALTAIDRSKKSNSTFYAQSECADAATRSLAELAELSYSPKPQEFLSSQRVVALIQEIYADDFKLFGYSIDKIPHKKASSEIDLIPDDFDWEIYLLLNPDLQKQGFSNKRSVMRHYLEFGRHESAGRSYHLQVPAEFVWQDYVAIHEDLVAAGIDNEREAIIHYLAHGKREGRAYREL